MNVFQNFALERLALYILNNLRPHSSTAFHQRDNWSFLRSTTSLVRSTGEVVERLWKSWESRASTRAALASAVAGTIERAEQQMDAIAGVCLQRSGRLDGACP